MSESYSYTPTTSTNTQSVSTDSQLHVQQQQTQLSAVSQYNPASQQLQHTDNNTQQQPMAIAAAASLEKLNQYLSSFSVSEQQQDAMASTDANPTQNKLFVGQIPPFTSEETLRAAFSPYGTITHVVILKDRYTGQHKGCGFVCYAHRHESDAAIAALSDKVRLPNAKREMIVRYAGEKPEENEYKLYACMLSRQSTEADIRRLFEPYGQLTEVFITRAREGGHSKGAAFIKYTTRDAAEAAIAGLHEKVKDKDAPGLVQVRFAHTKDERAQHLSHIIGNQATNMQLLRGQHLLYAHPNLSFDPYQTNPYITPTNRTQYQQHTTLPSTYTNQSLYSTNIATNATAYNQNAYDSTAAFHPLNRQSHSPLQHRQVEIRGPTGANLFVFNIPSEYTEAELATLFGNFGTVLSTRIQRNPHTGHSKGYGFVSFDTAASAQQAIEALDGFSIGPKKLTVRLKSGSNQQQQLQLSSNPSLLQQQQQQQQQQYQSPSLSSLPQVSLQQRLSTFDQPTLQQYSHY